MKVLKNTNSNFKKHMMMKILRKIILNTNKRDIRSLPVYLSFDKTATCNQNACNVLIEN